MPEFTDFLPRWIFPFILALVMGLLIGIEREARQDRPGQIMAGVRTFPIITLAGFVSAYWFSPGIFLATLLLFGLLLTAAYVVQNYGTANPGLTTEFSAVLAFLLGGMAAAGQLLPALIIAVTATTLLANKKPLHSFVSEYIGREELVAIVKFALVAAVVFPLLPDQAFTALELNPRKIWLMVVLVSGISFLGYFAIRLLGARKGLLLSAIFGGLVSSTAATISFARFSRNNPALSAGLASGIILATAMMFLRQALILWVINPDLGRLLTLLILPAALVGGFFFWRTHQANQETAEIPLENPFELNQALAFGAIYAVTLIISELAITHYGSAGIYLLSVISGTTGIDAITLSIGNLNASGKLGATAALIGALLAALSSTVVKAGLALALGSTAIRRHIVWGMGGMLLAAVAGAVMLISGADIFKGMLQGG